MKIAYINGYSPNPSKSDKIGKLEKIIGSKIDWIVYNYNDSNSKSVQEQIKDYDLIISSSTGSYIARLGCYKYNVPLISFNPVIDLEETFNLLGLKVPKIKYREKLGLEELIIVTKDDELIPYIKTIKKFPKTIVKSSGGHRFCNIEVASDDILSFLSRIH